jgi:hypothetical protein
MQWAARERHRERLISRVLRHCDAMREQHSAAGGLRSIGPNKILR